MGQLILGRLSLSKYGNAQSDFLEEVNRILDAAKAEGVLLRLLGALAFHIHCPKFSYMQEMLGRTFTDIDFASYKKETCANQHSLRSTWVPVRRASKSSFWI